MLYSLQIGRAFAILAVVIHHITIAPPSFVSDMPENWAKVLNMGYLGVDYFFVLSGFIIAHITYQQSPNNSNARHYFFSRMIRVFVPYMPIAIATLGALLIMPDISMGARREISVLGSLFLVPSNAPTALQAAWTLQHEMVFYMLFGLCCFGLKRRWTIFLWLLPISVMMFWDGTRMLRILAGPINIEFLMGVAACSLYYSRRLFRWRYVLVTGGLVWTLLTTMWLVENIYADMRIFAGFGFAAIILGLVYLEHEIKFKKFRQLVFLGEASYALYLTQSLVISLLSRQDFIPKVPWFVAACIVIMITVTVGVIYHLYVEKPMLACARKRLLLRRK